MITCGGIENKQYITNEMKAGRNHLSRTGSGAFKLIDIKQRKHVGLWAERVPF
jgi:hypothetical protein